MVLPDYNEVENAVIDNLGFVVELVHEKKSCVEPEIFYMKISKYMERIYSIINRFHSSLLPTTFYDFFGKLNDYRKAIGDNKPYDKNDFKD